MTQRSYLKASVSQATSVALATLLSTPAIAVDLNGASVGIGNELPRALLKLPRALLNLPQALLKLPQALLKLPQALPDVSGTLLTAGLENRR